MYFVEKVDGFAKNRPTAFNKFCDCILRECILLSINCKGENEDGRQENALRIFNTLNNRGEFLSDADIFKGIIFKHKKLEEEEKKKFTQRWKDLELQTKKIGVDINFLFRNYMHVIRARNGIKGDEVGLRYFFMEERRDDKEAKENNRER